MHETDEQIMRICRTTPVKTPVWVSAACEDTREFARLVINQLAPGERVLDLGTGTGILAICLARLSFEVVATDLSTAAVRTALANAERNSVRFDCYRSDLLESVEGRFDLIAFNPPFNVCRDTFLSNVLKSLLRRLPLVRRSTRGSMPQAVVRFRQQLIRRLLAQAPDHLTPGGRILLHSFEFDVPALREVLPAEGELKILDFPPLHANRSFGALIRLQPKV